LFFVLACSSDCFLKITYTNGQENDNKRMEKFFAFFWGSFLKYKIIEVFVNGKCFNYVTIGQYCVYTSQCQGGSICTNNYCACPVGTVVDGSNCTEVGKCWSHQILIDKICYDKANVGQFCKYDQQCQGGSSCISMLCTCPFGTIIRNNSTIGQTCLYDEQCESGSTCTSGFCACPSGTTYLNNWCVGSGHCRPDQVYVRGLCYDKVDFGEFCYLNEQCSKNASCITNRCQCPKGMVITNGLCAMNSQCYEYQVSVNGICMDSVSIGMKCAADSQCIGQFSSLVFNSHILSRFPKYTNYTDGDCQTLVPIGQYCSYSSQCMGFSACIRSICECPAGFEQFNDVCRKRS
uniref:EB domain-containing protein n=1 Tax=Dracunculus medinensis TaxID=318479 RepID=A0A0N4UMW7_DRAME